MIAVALALALQAEPAAQASAQNMTAAAPPATPPHWVQHPSAEDFARYYPVAAAAAGKAGVVAMRCTMTAEGTLTACAILVEKPAGYSFGAATLRLAPLFKMAPPPKEDGGSVTIPVRWAAP